MSRLKTLLRVAELQEAVARGAAAKALESTRVAQQAYDDRLALLHAGGVDGGTREALATSTARQLVRAEGVAAARVDQHAAELAQRQAVAGWTHARRQHRLFTELAEREREQVRAERERRDQQLADELASTRQVRR